VLETRPVSMEWRVVQSSVTDSADIFPVCRPTIVRKKLKISAQSHEPFSRYSCDK
jgi:hypothetical protein